MRSFVLVCSILISLPLIAQESVDSLLGNSVLTHAKRMQVPMTEAAATLPFVDDFSYQSSYPNPANWLDSTVFVNGTFPIFPPSNGVATFDGLKANGRPHSSANNAFGSADTLTSVEIDLSGLDASDSVYLSFFVQPQGLGNPPETRDTFLCEFKVNDTTWETQYRIQVNDLLADSFYQVFLPVFASKWLQAGFQFRFRNYASLTGNVDHWHLDYVRLDKDRTIANRLLNDVAYYRNGRPLLKRYRSMPLNQIQGFTMDELGDSLYAHARNHFNTVKNTTFRYDAYENCTGSQLDADFFETINFPPLTDTVLLEAAYKNELATYLDNSTCDSLVITTRYFLNNSPPDPGTSFNDTVVHKTGFYNYFAYDDGTAEVAYRLQGQGGQIAYKFVFNKPDSLRAIQIHWAYVDGDISDNLINLVIWESLDQPSGVEDSIRYREDLIKPVYVDSMNGFYTYVLDSGLYVEDSIYIGFQQTSMDDLRIGFDQNNDASAHTFYYVAGSWKQSSLPGALLMRPVIGAPLPVGIEKRPTQQVEALTVYPNPVSHVLNIQLPEAMTGGKMTVYNIIGQPVWQGEATQRLSTSDLASGWYLIRLDNGEQIYQTKFLKTR